jgi:ABC-2 type transport system ATP-binding protein
MMDTVLEVAAARAAYATQLVLDGVDLQLRRGEWLTLVGPNASGKSTLLHCIVGHVPLLSGAVRICGHSLQTERLAALRALGFACAPERLPALLTGRQCLEIYAAAKELQGVDDEVLELAGILQFTHFLEQPVSAYSLGTRQKLSVLLAFVGRPTLLVFDEVFNGLDPVSSLALKHHIRRRVDQRACGVLLATHGLDVLEHYSDEAALLLNGRIVHAWSHEELRALRVGAQQFETVLADTARHHAAPSIAAAPEPGSGARC